MNPTFVDINFQILEIRIVIPFCIFWTLLLTENILGINLLHVTDVTDTEHITEGVATPIVEHIRTWQFFTIHLEENNCVKKGDFFLRLTSKVFGVFKIGMEKKWPFRKLGKYYFVRNSLTEHSGYI